MLEIKHNVTKMKNAFYGLISRLDTAPERIPKTDDISIVTPQNLKSKENRDLKKKRMSKDCGSTTNGVNTHAMKMPEREGREKRTQDISEIIMTKNLLKLMSDTKPQI